MRADFTGPFLKLERAREHIDDLNSEILSFKLREPYRVLAQNDQQNVTTVVWVAKIREQVPNHFAAIIGDATHNLRCALDLAVSAIVSTRGQSLAGVGFPTADNINGFCAAVDRLKSRVGSKVARVLRTRLQSYMGGEFENLRFLHNLDKSDKHRVIIPVAHNIMIHRLEVESKGISVALTENVIGPYQDGAPFFRSARTYPGPRGGTIEVDDEARTYFEVAIDYSGKFEFKEVVGLLFSFSDDVKTALDSLSVIGV